MAFYILVEDNATIVESLVPALQEIAGLECIGSADTAKGAIAALANDARWNLAVIDLFLKEGSGLEVLQAIQTRRFDQRVVVLSNYATADMRRVFSELGADASFDKSTEIEKFFEYCLKLHGGAVG